MSKGILSAAEAAQYVRSNPTKYVVEVSRGNAHLFNEPGWVEQQDAGTSDSVRFINRRREAWASLSNGF